MKIKKIRGTIGCELRIKNAPERLRKQILTAFRYPNPAYVSALKFSPYGYVSPTISPEITLATEEGSRLCLPRGIDIERKLSTKAQALFKRVRWTDNRIAAPVSFPQLQIALNKQQKFILRAFNKDREEREKFGTFLYVMPTSTGKTIMLAQAAKLLGQRTLVLFNTTQIRKAWYHGLEQAYGLVKSDLGLIQQSTWRIGDSYTLGSIQTIARRKQNWDELFKEFGTLIVDEADLVTAPSYWQFVLSCPAKYILGSTATDKPEGMKEHIYLRACFGETRKRVMATHRDTDTSMGLQKVRTITTQFAYKKDHIDWHDLTEHLMSSERRNALIVKQVQKDIAKGLPCLVVTKRLAHVELLYDMLKERGVKANRLTGETNTDTVYTEKLIENILNGKVTCVVATIPAIMRGANLNPLAVLHIAIPAAKKNVIEQLVGRIRRKAKGKKRCICTYYLDVNCSYLFNLYKRIAVPTFRRLKVPEFQNRFIA